MSISAVIRQGFACVLGLFAWWYFYSVENIFYPEWLGILIAAFVITIAVLIVSKNIMLSVAVIVLYHLAFSPNIILALKDGLPVAGGIAAGISLWKLL